MRIVYRQMLIRQIINWINWNGCLAKHCYSVVHVNVADSSKIFSLEDTNNDDDGSSYWPSFQPIQRDQKKRTNVLAIIDDCRVATESTEADVFAVCFLGQFIVICGQVIKLPFKHIHTREDKFKYKYYLKKNLKSKAICLKMFKINKQIHI